MQSVDLSFHCKCRRRSSPAISRRCPLRSITGGTIKDPLNDNAPFAGNIIPASRISPVCSQAAAVLPGVQSARPGQQFLRRRTQHGSATTRPLDRIDQNIGDKIRLYVRAHWQNWDAFGGNSIPVNGSTTPTDVTNYTVGYTHTLTPNLVNDFRVGRNFFNTATVNPFYTSTDQTSAGTDLGIPGFNGDSIYNNPGIPDFNITGFNGLGNGSTTGSRMTARTSSPNRSVGATARTTSWRARNSAGWPPAAPPSTALAARSPSTARRAGYAPADFILGIPQSFATAGPEVRGRVAEWRDGFFVLDKWQVSRKLTLNYGLRYELPTVPYTINGVCQQLNAEPDGR